VRPCPQHIVRWFAPLNPEKKFGPVQKKSTPRMAHIFSVMSEVFLQIIGNQLFDNQEFYPKKALEIVAQKPSKKSDRKILA